MPVIITAKYDGFRRCGMAHTVKAVEHPDGAFTKEQIKALKAEPMLLVQEIKTETETEGEAKPEAKPKGKKE